MSILVAKLYSLIDIYSRFGGTCCLCLQDGSLEELYYFIHIGNSGKVLYC
jgi:hypothetical protein